MRGRKRHRKKKIDKLLGSIDVFNFVTSALTGLPITMQYVVVKGVDVDVDVVAKDEKS